MNKYGPKAQKKVEKAIHEMKQGELKSGTSDKPVTDPEQAVAIGLSKARKEGGKVPTKDEGGDNIVDSKSQKDHQQ